MAYRSYIREHLLVVRWQAVTLEDIDQIATQVRLVRVQQRREVIYAGLQGDDVAPPDASVRKGMLSHASALAKSTKRYHLVIDGAGMGASVHRTIIRGLIGTARALRFEVVQKVRLFGSVREMLEFDRDDLPASVGTLLHELKAAGMLEPEPEPKPERAAVGRW